MKERGGEGDILFRLSLDERKRRRGGILSTECLGCHWMKEREGEGDILSRLSLDDRKKRRGKHTV